MTSIRELLVKRLYDDLRRCKMRNQSMTVNGIWQIIMFPLSRTLGFLDTDIKVALRDDLPDRSLGLNLRNKTQDMMALDDL
mgnify:CR=1 FL=1